MTVRLSVAMGERLRELGKTTHEGRRGVAHGSDRDQTYLALQRRGLVDMEKAQKANGHLWLVTPKGWDEIAGVPWS